MFEDTKGLIRIRKSKNKQHNGQKKVQKDKQRSTKHTHTTIDRVTRTPLNPGVNAGRVSSSCSTNGARRYRVPHIKKEMYLKFIGKQTCFV
jgi:TFIIF-interacting CTD phosphatase-like protein